MLLSLSHPAPTPRPWGTAEDVRPAMPAGGGLLPDTGTSVCLPAWAAERALRQQIDLAVGRALVDHAFAARLLARPGLALGQADCEPARYLRVGRIRALDLDDFARQIFDQVWGPAAPWPDDLVGSPY